MRILRTLRISFLYLRGQPLKMMTHPSFAVARMFLLTMYSLLCAWSPSKSSTNAPSVTVRYSCSMAELVVITVKKDHTQSMFDLHGIVPFSSTVCLNLVIEFVIKLRGLVLI